MTRVTIKFCMQGSLFLYAGIIIHLIKDNQDIWYYGNLSEIVSFVSTMLDVYDEWLIMQINSLF